MSVNNLESVPESDNVSPVIGVGVLVWKNKRLLLGKRINKDQSYCWQFPGGHLENNESITGCARREVLEETGLQVRKMRHLGFTDKPFEINKQQYITLLVSCEYESGDARVLEPDKCEAWQWFDYTKLPTHLFLPIRLFLDQQFNSQTTILNRDDSTCDDLYALHCAAEVLPVTPLSEHK